MSIELDKFSNLGKIDEIIFVLTDVLSENSKSYVDISNYCLSNNNFYNLSIKGILALLNFIGVLSYTDSGLFLNESGIKLKLISNKELARREIVIKILEKITSSENLLKVLNFEKIHYDYIVGSFVLKNTDVHFRYSALRNLLINLRFFSNSIDYKNLLIIDSEYNNVLNLVRKRLNARLSLEKFKEIQSLKERYGEEAEDFVVKFERIRLKDHPEIRKISKISGIDVSAGYDIVSFNDLTSIHHDRFIEVKSYFRELKFHWSANEVETAREKEENYYLYLIDRVKVNNPNYAPEIIKNPYSKVFEGTSWSKEAESWIIRLQKR